MVNFSIAVVAVLLASPTSIDAFQLPQRRRHHNIIVHHSSRGDYNNYRDEYERERGSAPRGEYGFDQWDDDPINREKNGYDGYDWRFQRENDNGDINDVNYRQDPYSSQRDEFSRSQQYQQNYKPSRNDWRNNRLDYDRWYDGSNGSTDRRYSSQQPRRNNGRIDNYDRQYNAYREERPQDDFAYSNDYYERANDGPYGYQRQRNNSNNNGRFYNSRTNNRYENNRTYNERNRQKGQGSSRYYDNYSQRNNENYAIYLQQRQNNSPRDDDYYRENNYDYPKQELIRDSEMEFPMMPSFPSILPRFPSLFRNMFSGPMMMPSFPSFFGDDMMMMMPSSNTVRDVMQQAREQIANDEIVQQRMGGAVDEMIRPFSQNVASNTFNGKRSTSVKAAFEVVGKNGRVGVATVEARDDEIIALFVDLDGERIRLPLMRRRGGGNGGDVVDAEIID
eukprot:scaffold62487_cov47-Cyclotella_meneghiniana.AAC.6